MSGPAKDIDEKTESHRKCAREQKIKPPDGEGPWGEYLEGDGNPHLNSINQPNDYSNEQCQQVCWSVVCLTGSSDC